MKYILWLLAALIALVLIPHPATHAQDQQINSTYFVYLPLVAKPPPGGQTTEQYQMALQVLDLVNSERAAATPACAPLTMNEKLIVAAQGHTQDMALYDFFDHTNPDPARATIGMRATAAGYSWSMIGENIAAGHTTPAEVMVGWMNSSGHRANILNCSFTEIGIGYYYQADDQPLPGNSWPYYHYWTQDFGKPR